MAFTTLDGRKVTQVMGMDEPAWQENVQYKKEGLKLSSNKFQHLVLGGGKLAQKLNQSSQRVFHKENMKYGGGWWQGTRRFRDGGAVSVEGWGFTLLSIKQEENRKSTGGFSKRGHT